MTIEHSLITDPEIHEPKGVATAGNKSLYVANGSGSGSWRTLTFDDITGNIAYGSLVITNNSTNFAVSAVADTTFSTASQFTVMTGTGAPWASETLFGVTFSTDRLIVPYTGVYKIDAYMNISAFPSNTARIAIRHLRNGTTYSSRPPIIKSAVAGDVSQLVGFGLTSLNANDFMQIAVASDTTGNLLVRDMNVVLTLVRRTA